MTIFSPSSHGAALVLPFRSRMGRKTGAALALYQSQQWGRQSHHDAQLSPIKALTVQRIEQMQNGFHGERAPSVLSVSNPFYPLKLRAENYPLYPFPIRSVR